MKHGLFIYGLYRKATLDAIFDDCPEYDFGFERPLNTIAALSGGLRYVNKVLFTKTLHRRTFSERNPADPFARAKSGRRYLDKTLMVARWILRARTVAWYRKLYVPLLVGPRLMIIARNALAEAAPMPLRRIARRLLHPDRSGL